MDKDAQGDQDDVALPPVYPSDGPPRDPNLRFRRKRRKKMRMKRMKNLRSP